MTVKRNMICPLSSGKQIYSTKMIATSSPANIEGGTIAAGFFETKKRRTSPAFLPLMIVLFNPFPSLGPVLSYWVVDYLL